MTSGFISINSTSLLLLLGIIFLIKFAEAQNLTYAGHACNVNTWGDNYVYANLVSDVLLKVVYVAPADPNFVDYETLSSGDNVVYGYGLCSSAISIYECNDCLTAAYDQLTNTCGDAIGGGLTLGDCKIRYEDYDFYPS